MPHIWFSVLAATWAMEGGGPERQGIWFDNRKVFYEKFGILDDEQISIKQVAGQDSLFSARFVALEINGNLHFQQFFIKI